MLDLQTHKRCHICYKSRWTLRFFGKASPLSSNFHHSKIKVNEVLYSCNEQQYQKGKANEFEDEEAAARIMTTTNSSKMFSIWPDNQYIWGKKMESDLWWYHAKRSEREVLSPKVQGDFAKNRRWPYCWVKWQRCVLGYRHILGWSKKLEKPGMVKSSWRSS